MRGRLINVSNRLPVQARKHAGGIRLVPSSGGLATALDSVWRQETGAWIGWPGSAHEKEVRELLRQASKERTHELKPVTLTDDEVAKFYSGFANEIVWPLFHDMPTRCNFDPSYWKAYEQVNQKFARAVSNTAEPDDFIWVHDYHLMLVAHYLRQAGLRTRAGFFLHIPFPAPDVFEKLPWREPILRCLLEFDLIGFQTARDCKNFVRCLQRLVPETHTKTEGNRVRLGIDSRECIAGSFPISIDFDEFANQANHPHVAASAAEIRSDLKGKMLILGVDRLDYTKGIPERLKAFRIALKHYRELRKKVTFVQVVVPSRENIPRYKDLRHDVELLVSQINGEFTQPGWVPVHYMHRSLGREDLVTYYRAADLAVITPLKDGMNLVAKEFCASQVDERGVLIVSEFAGASQELQSGAMVVNPNDLAGVADAIHCAFLMPRQERQVRMHLLREIVRKNDVHRWAHSFMRAAAELEEETGGNEPAIAEQIATTRHIPLDPEDYGNIWALPQD
jgi:alpha,alpha-trehalose-phosphate synthase [UDP-forming]